MNTTITPETIAVSWDDYLAKRYDIRAIPWERYRWDDGMVVPVGSESFRNALIADRLQDWFKAWIKEHNKDWWCFGDKLEVEVRFTKRRCRIPDLLVLSSDTLDQLEDESDTITWEMPAPVIAVEIVSPSSEKIDIEEKEAEYLDRGVGEYISVDWRKGVVIVRSHIGNKTYTYNKYTSGESLYLSTMPDLMINVNALLSGKRTRP